MSDYKRVLVAVDLSEHSDQVVKRAQFIAKAFQAEISLLHVVEYVPVEPMGEALLPAVDIEDELVQGARRRLDELAERTGVPGVDRRVENGTIKSEVVRVAEEINADLVILGSRERHGVAVLLNLTEDTILHAAPCDVLAIRLAD
ncbi:MAG: universal stress protein [Gammaproteobacteria bacterium]|nr:MAG: universal stress protein [Gammaproteobacteria bacterium]